MKKRFFKNKLLFICIFMLVSCATADTAYSLVEDKNTKTEIYSVIGNITFNSGFYLPSVNNSIEISLVSDEGFVLSKQSISNVQKFPLQCVLKYDRSEVEKNMSYSVTVVLTTAEKSYKAQQSADLSKDKTTVNLSL